MKELIHHRAAHNLAALSPVPKPMPDAQVLGNDEEPEAPSQIERPHPREARKIGWALLWLLGIPLSVVVLLYLLKGYSGG